MIQGRLVPGLVTGQPYASHIPQGTDTAEWVDRTVAAKAAYTQASEDGSRDQLVESLAAQAGRSAILLLIDQSGSMRNNLVSLAGQILLLAEEFDRLGIESSILGYTTVSWKGGKARQAWINAGRRKHPGRLCELLHIIYKPFDKPLAMKDWEALLDVGTLKENVDGEALQWAAETLRGAQSPDKRLVVLSDGAPVDDSTMVANGAGFLWRHFRQVANELRKNGDLRTALIRLGDYDPQCFSHDAKLEDPAQFLRSFAELMRLMNEPPVVH